MPEPSGVFTRTSAERDADLLVEITARVEEHRERCAPYGRIMNALGYDPEQVRTLADIPPLPVGLFKDLELRSVAEDDVVRVLQSSGTTGSPSRIFLDRDATIDQQQVLADTLASVLGSERLPMLIVDTEAVTTDEALSARGAGVLGLMPFGREHTFVLDADGEVDLDRVRDFLRAFGDQPFAIFGFTFMVWIYLYEPAHELGLDLSQGVLLHSGGWKKLADRSVSNEDFRTRLGEAFGLSRIHNFYGMAEQIGVVYLEGPSGGDLYAPDMAQIVIRDPFTLEPVPHGTEGLIEVLSSLPRSYPGNALLTEDVGVINGVDDGDWPGPRFSVLRRLPRAEPRGCSDTFTADDEPEADAGRAAEVAS